jgi:hypothetical protein
VSIKFTTTLSVQGMSAPAQPQGTGRGELRQWIRARKVWRKQAELIAAGATEGAGRVAKIIYDKSQEYVPVGDTRVLKDTADYGIVQSASLGSDPEIVTQKVDLPGNARYQNVRSVLPGGVGATQAVFAVIYPASYARIVHDRVYGPSGKKVYHADPTGAFFLARAVEETRDQCEEALASAVNDWVKSKGRRGGYNLKAFQGVQDIGISKASASQTLRRAKNKEGAKISPKARAKAEARYQTFLQKYFEVGEEFQDIARSQEVRTEMGRQKFKKARKGRRVIRKRLED